jgi:hypothetical protein
MSVYINAVIGRGSTIKRNTDETGNLDKQGRDYGNFEIIV